MLGEALGGAVAIARVNPFFLLNTASRDDVEILDRHERVLVPVYAQQRGLSLRRGEQAVILQREGLDLQDQLGQRSVDSCPHGVCFIAP